MWYCINYDSPPVMYNICKFLNSKCIPYHLDYDTRIIVIYTQNDNVINLIQSFSSNIDIKEITEERAKNLIRFSKSKSNYKFRENDIVIAKDGVYKNQIGFIASTIGVEEKGGYKVEFYIMDRIIVDRVPGEHLMRYTNFD